MFLENLDGAIKSALALEEGNLSLFNHAVSCMRKAAGKYDWLLVKSSSKQCQLFGRASSRGQGTLIVQVDNHDNTRHGLRMQTYIGSLKAGRLENVTEIEKALIEVIVLYMLTN